MLLPETANLQNEENKWFQHDFCRPPTGKMVLLQAVQIQLLLLLNKNYGTCKLVCVCVC